MFEGRALISSGPVLAMSGMAGRDDMDINGIYLSQRAVAFLIHIGIPVLVQLV